MALNDEEEAEVRRAIAELEVAIDDLGRRVEMAEEAVRERAGDPR